MLYAISGSSSCGKTTILSKLQELDYLVIGKQYARELLISLDWTIKDIVKSKQNTDYFHEHCLLNKQSHEQGYITSTRTLLTERSFIDIFIYYAIYYEQYFNSSLISKIVQMYYKKDSMSSLKEYLLDSEKPLFYLLQKCIELDAKYYHKIFLLMDNPIIEDDHVRIIDKEFINKQKAIYKMIIQIFPWYKDHMIEIKSLDLIDRLTTIVSKLS